VLSLLRNKANRYIVDDDGNTSLSITLNCLSIAKDNKKIKKYIKILYLLIVDPLYMSAVDCVSKNDYYLLESLLLQNNDKDIIINNNNLLHIAIEFGNVNIVNVLLSWYSSIYLSI
jgi:ankyrin repeat protein